MLCANVLHLGFASKESGVAAQVNMCVSEVHGVVSQLPIYLLGLVKYASSRYNKLVCFECYVVFSRPVVKERLWRPCEK